MISRFNLAVLQLMHTPGIGPRTLSKVLTSAAEQKVAIEEVVGGGATELSRFGLKAGTSEALLSVREQVERIGEQLDAQGVRLLVQGTPDYPTSLLSRAGSEAPPVLTVWGPQDMLERKAVAICGSRRASEKGVQITRACAGQLARRGVNVVSGYANGVDLAAHAAALEAGGVTTLVLAEGLLRFKPKPEVAKLLAEGNYLLLSQFKPRSAWSAANAMQRNATILGLADAVLVIESGLEGGTYAAAEAAIASARPLFVVDYLAPPPSAEGNRYFLSRGARPLRMGRDGLPNLTEVFKAPDEQGLLAEPDRPLPAGRDLFGNVG